MNNINITADFTEYKRVFLEENSKRNLISKNDEKFLGMEITDAINNYVFCEGDTVVVCKKCNAIMHESSWIDNGNLCGICEGTNLREINQKPLKKQ